MLGGWRPGGVTRFEPTGGKGVRGTEGAMGRGMREFEATLQQFGEFLLRGRLVKESAAPS